MIYCVKVFRNEVFSRLLIKILDDTLVWTIKKKLETHLHDKPSLRSVCEDLTTNKVLIPIICHVLIL